MTDKEQIMIDGVNVLECEHYQYKSLKDCEMRYPESGDCEIGLLNYLFDGNLDMEKLCKDNPNCYFKQLARKTQECEQLEEKYEALKLESQEGYEIVAELKHECEELKDKLKIYEKMFDNPEFTVALTDIRTGERDIREQRDKRLTKEFDRYRKALEEIEKIVSGNYEILDPLAKQQISSIVNKAKGEGNEE